MERIDDLQYGGFRLIQDSDLFCFSTDAVLLSAFATIHKGENVIDFGAGAGILEVLLYSRQPSAFYKAVEIQEPLFRLLEKNIILNGMENVSEAFLGNIKDAHLLFGSDNDVCVCNPPFEKADDGSPRRSPTEDIARKELAITFEEICMEAGKCLRTHGRFYLVHRTSRLAEIFFDMKNAGIEPKLLQLVAGSPGKEPRMCLIMGQRGAREGMRVLPTLTALDENGKETPQLARIYRRGEQNT